MRIVPCISLYCSCHYFLSNIGVLYEKRYEHDEFGKCNEPLISVPVMTISTIESVAALPKMFSTGTRKSGTNAYLKQVQIKFETTRLKTRSVLDSVPVDFMNQRFSLPIRTEGSDFHWRYHRWIHGQVAWSVDNDGGEEWCPGVDNKWGVARRLNLSWVLILYAVFFFYTLVWTVGIIPLTIRGG